jgi:c-di-AMP phosphodiesterase-like protein
MNHKQIRSLILGLLLLVTLTTCVGNTSPEQMAEVDKQIIAEIRQRVPVPDSAYIVNNIAGTLRYDTDMTVEEVAAFYRDAFTQKNMAEQSGGTVSADAANLSFADAQGSSEVTVQVEKRDPRPRVTVSY